MAVDMFLKIQGIDGESRDNKHKGEIEVLSFSWGISNRTSTQPGGGGGAGKAQLQDFSIVKYLDTSSPQLFEKCCTGEHIQDINLTLVRKDTKQEYFKIKLQDVLISSVAPNGSVGGNGDAMEQVSFSFSALHISAADARGNTSDISCNTGGGVKIDGAAEPEHH